MTRLRFFLRILRIHLARWILGSDYTVASVMGVDRAGGLAFALRG